MNTVLLIVHLFVTLLLIGVVLIQRSEGGGLGIGTSQGMGSFMTGRGTANLLTRATAILAVIFFALSMVLAALNKGGGPARSILDTLPAPARTAPAGSAPTGPAPAGPAPGGPAPAGPAPSGAIPGGTAPAAPATAAPTPAPAGPTPAAPPAGSSTGSPAGPSAPTN